MPRYRCNNPGCKKLHHILPDILVPFKHYQEEVIVDSFDGRIDPSQSADRPSEKTVRHWGHWLINTISIDSEPYEVLLYAMDEIYHLIFGHYSDGSFLCVPELNMGCQLGALDDADWNLHALLGTNVLDYEECTAITVGLAYIIGIINNSWPGRKAPVSIAL